MGIERKVWDVNILAIFLVEDHPGHAYVAPVVEEGLRGVYTPIVLDIAPIRVYWILERRWGVDKRKASRAVVEFLRRYKTPRYVPLRRDTVVRSFELARNLKHDVYDCVYLAVALQENASSIVTTDTDFERLCPAVGLKYENPVPKEVLRRFGAYRPTGLREPAT